MVIREMSQMKKILVYSHDTYGLGNIRRMMTVVEHLARGTPGASILVLSGSPMMQAFRLSPGVDYIKMPCLMRSQDGRYSPKFLDLPYEKILGLRADLILNTVLEFEPDLMLIDKKPLGVQNELAPTFDVLRRKARRPKLALLLRDILDNPQTTIEIWKRNGYHETIQELYDAVLVLGAPEIFDTAAEYAFPPSTVEKLVYCGYIRKQRGRRRPIEVRRELRLGDEPLVMATAGGGEDGYRLLSVFLAALKHKDAIPFHSLVFVGPEMPAHQQQHLRKLASLLPRIDLMEFSNDVMSYMGAANLVVAMGGYNTVTEILSLGKRAIIVPRIKPVEEQWIRATRLERLDSISVIHPDQVTAERLSDSVNKLLNCSNVPHHSVLPPDMDGLKTITSVVQRLLADKSTYGWSQLLSNDEAADQSVAEAPVSLRPPERSASHLA